MTGINYRDKYLELEEKYKELENELKMLKSGKNNFPVSTKKAINDSQVIGKVPPDLSNIVNSYLISFKYGDDKKFHILEINKKVEEIESVNRNELVGKCIDETPLAKRKKLNELLNHINKHKIPVSVTGDDSEGFYVGFILTSGHIIIIWEPGRDQKIADEIYKQSVLFHEFAEFMPEIMYEVDLNGKVVFGNKTGLEFFGLTQEDLDKNLSITDLFPEMADDMLRNVLALNSPGDILINEYILKSHDGIPTPIVTRTYPIFHEGKKIGYRGTASDTSKHKNIETEVIKQKAFIENLVNSTSEAIVITDPSGKIVMINREFHKLFGYTFDEAINKNIYDMIVPERLKDDAIAITKFVTPYQQETRETIRKDKFGNEIQVSLVATGISIDEKIVGNIAIYKNISIEKKNQVLQEILYNISSAALTQVDVDKLYSTIVKELGKIWDTNNFFIALYEKKSETVSLPFFSDEKDSFNEIPINKTITGYLIKTNQSVLLKENDMRQLEQAGEIDLVGTDCKVWMGVPLRVENDVIGVMCLQDYNDENKFTKDDLNVLDFIANHIAVAIQRRITLDNLITARQKAEDAAQSKQLFMSTMSHEIRTPLNEVIGITNLLLQDNPREDQMDFIKTLRFSGNHLLTLVNDVLDYNKMESGKIVFEQTQFNLNDFLDEIMRSYSFRSKAKHLDFTIKKEGDLPAEVIGDQIRLNQILSNLLSNALKFTKRGGITVTIRELERKNRKANLQFSVRDTGIGIPDEMHEAIFESFTQASADTTRRFGGTGLGLAICKKLVELQGGKIHVISELGLGSTFIFNLFLEVPDESVKANEVKTVESYSYVGLEGKKILIAEDNKINFFVTNKFLTGWGIIVTHAENGQLAIEKIQQEDFDLVLMDLHMPIMDGIEATRRIRESSDPKIKNIPIVALTAAIMSENHDKIEELNINDYVLKPFKPHDLFERIKKHIR